LPTFLYDEQGRRVEQCNRNCACLPYLTRGRALKCNRAPFCPPFTKEPPVSKLKEKSRAAGEAISATEPRLAGGSVPKIATELQSLQRQRAWHLKSRNMMANRLQATVAGTLGYRSGLKESERTAVFREASKLIKQIVDGEVASNLKGIVLATTEAIKGFNNNKKFLEKQMLAFAKQLPVAPWVEHVDQRGFGLPFLAIVIGETGDLANYANPAKVWRRLGCAPHTFDGKTLMGATWRSGKHGKLPASEWEEFGYSPRRRSIAYLIGESLVKHNQDGPYRKRYDETKLGASRKHPEWIRCPKCEGTGKKGAMKTTCGACKGTGEVWMHCHLHGMLLATKRLLRNLWIEWNK